MSYTIEPRAVTDFLKDKLELPIFQRAPSWKESQNFNLLLSVFKGFPIGVVVVSSEDGGSRKVLLDGRQRREALSQMADPDAIAHWAFRSLRLRGKRLSKNASSEEWEEAFWARVEEFIGNPDSGAAGSADTDLTPTASPSGGDEEAIDAQTSDEIEVDGQMDDPESQEEGGDEEEDDADDEEQGADEDDAPASVPPAGLSLQNLEPMEQLLHILLLSRKKAYSRLFDFRNQLAPHPKLKYLVTDSRGDEVVSTAALSQWLRDAATTWGEDLLTSPDALFNSLNDQYIVSDPDGLRDRIGHDWRKLVQRIRAVLRLEDYLRNTRLGYIEVSAPTAADEMKIFELINTGGTPLTSAEILSAKRDWNIEVENAPNEVKHARLKLYQEALRIPPRDDTVRRWDVAATTLNRLNLPWIFGPFNMRKKAQFEAQTILGFQLYAGRYVGKLMKDDLGDLGSNSSVAWGSGSFDTEVSKSLDAASCVPLSYWQGWNKSKLSIRGSMSAAVALEFLLLLVTDWRRKGEPTSGSKRQALQKNAVVSLDRLVFEYLTRRWAGSSDSKIAADLRAFSDGPDVVSPVPQADWLALIEQALAGEDRFSPPRPRAGGTTVRKEMRLLLLYFCMLRGIEPPEEADQGCAVDHIIPEAKFQASASHGEFRNRITNLALVPYNFNQRKSDHAMDALPATHATWLKAKINQYEQIPETSLKSYTSAAEAADLHAFRSTIYRETFKDHRAHFLEHLTPM